MTEGVFIKVNDIALEVLRSIASHNLRIIFDPVNLLCAENVGDRERVIGEAMEKLCDHIAMVHLKDFIRREGALVSVAAGTGEMDYKPILRFLKARKPYFGKHDERQRRFLPRVSAKSV